MKKLIVLSAILSAASPAATVIDHLAAGQSSFSTGVAGPTAVVFGSIPLDERETAFSFKTGTTDLTFASLELLVNTTDNASAFQATISTGTNAPGGMNPVSLGTFTSSGFGSQLATFSLPSNALTFAPNTEYWVHLTVPTGGGIYSFSHSDAPVIAAPGWELRPSHSKLTTNPWVPDNPQLLVRARLNTVPEPSAAALAGLASLGLLLRRRR